MARVIHAKYTSKCILCGGTIAKGEVVSYDKFAPKGRKTCHYPQCPAKGTAPFVPLVEDHFTFSEFVDFARTALPSPSWANRPEGPSSTKERGDDWTSATYEQVINLAQNGWPEGLQALQHHELEATGALRLTRPKWEYGPAGCRPLVPLALTGAPSAMMRYTRQPDSRPVTRILAHLGSAHFIAASQFYNWGLGLLHLVDGIENGGGSVELTGRWESQSPDKTQRQQLDITLKTAGQPLDLDRLVLAIAHAGFFRRLIFRYLETKEELYAKFWETYGTCIPETPTTIDGFDLAIPSLLEHREVSQDTKATIALMESIYKSRGGGNG